MNGSWIDQIRHGHLIDPSQPLEPWMGDDLINERIIDGNESVNGIVDDLPEAHVLLLLKQGRVVAQRYEARNGFSNFIHRIERYFSLKILYGIGNGHVGG
jgi:hypothetical protein